MKGNHDLEALLDKLEALFAKATAGDWAAETRGKCSCKHPDHHGRLTSSIRTIASSDGPGAADNVRYLAALHNGAVSLFAAGRALVDVRRALAEGRDAARISEIIALYEED